MSLKENKAFVFPGWKVLLPVAAAAIIVGVIAFRGGLWPVGRGQWTAHDEQEALVEVAQSFSLAPLAAEEEDTFDREVSLDGLVLAAQEPGITLKETEMAALTEALTQLFGEKDLYENVEELEEGELEEFDQLLTSTYPYS